MNTWQLILADALVIAGTLALSLAVAGILRIPDPNAKLHASSKAVVLGTLVILAASIPGAELRLLARSVLIGILLLITSAAGAHALAKLQAGITRTSDSDE